MANFTNPLKNERSKMSLFNTTSLGIGTMIGGGIFALLGLAIKYGGAGTPISFAIAGLIALCTSYSYNKLTLLYQKKGGTLTFFNEVFSGSWLAHTLTIMLLLNYVIMISIYAYAFGTYGATFVPEAHIAYVPHLIIAIGILIPALINLLLTSKIIGKMVSIFVFVQLGIFIFFLIMGSMEVQPARLSPYLWPSALEIFEAGMLVFIVFEGFELISNTCEEVLEPKVNLPKAFPIAILCVILLYVGISVITIGGLPISTIPKVETYVLAYAAKPKLGQFGFKLMSTTAVLGSLGAATGSIFGLVRLVDYIYEPDKAEKGEGVNKKLSYLVIALVATVAILIANLVSLESIATMASGGFLTVYTFVNICNFISSEKTKSFKAFSGLATLLTFGAFVILIYHAATTHPKHILAISLFFALSIVLGFVSKKIQET